MNKLFFVLFVAFLATVGCSPVARFVIGMHKPKELDSTHLDTWSRKRNIANSPVFSLDTSYKTFINSIYSDKIILKNLNQPIMIMYFSNEILSSLNNNCNFPGIPNIQWNKFGDFNQFPPTCHFPDTTYHQIKLSEVKKYFSPTNEQSSQFKFSSGNCLVVVSCKMLNRQSKNLISLILENYSSHLSEIIFVNNDNYIFHYDKQFVLNN